MIDVGDIVQYLYCPRKVYFIRVAGVRITKPKMEEAKEVQAKAEKSLAKIAEKMGGELLKNVYLESQRYGIKGCVDAIVKTDDGYTPIDVKFSSFESVSYAWKMQLIAYSLLVEENFGCRVDKAYIYLASKRGKLMEIRIIPSDRRALRRVVDEIKELIKSEKYPRAAKSRKCGYCEVAMFCV
jgi:CRISPR-associated exonuclease Cas4